MRKSFVVLLCEVSALVTVIGFTGCATTPQAKEAKYLDRGKEWVKKGDNRRAILEFQNAVAAMPKDAEAQYQLALAYLAVNDGGAINALRRATELNPKHEKAQLLLAQLMTTSHNDQVVADAAGRIQAVLGDSPNNADATNLMALTEWRLGHVVDASKRLDEALKKFPARLQSSIELAQLKLSQKDLKGAEEVLKKAVASAPESPDAAIALGELYLLLDQPGNAGPEFQRALHLSPKNGTALLGQAAVAIAFQRMDEAERTLRELSALPDPMYKPLHANFLYRTGKREAALAELGKLCEENPSDRGLRTRRIATLIEMDRLSDAQQVLAGILKKNPRDLEAQLQRGQLFLRSGQLKQAEDDMNSVLHYSRESIGARIVLAAVYKAQGNEGRERELLGEVLKRNPGVLAARLEMAQILRKSNAQAALQTLNEAPAAQKAAPAFLVERNWALIQIGDHAQARASLNEALKTGRSPALVLQDGVLKYLDFDYDGARTAAEEVLRQVPEDLRAARLVADIYTAQNQPAKAIERLAQIAAEHPKAGPLQELLGLQYLKARNLTAARQAYMAAKNANPASSEADLALAEIDIRENQRDRAVERLTALIATQPRNVPAIMRLSSLRESQGDFPAAIALYRSALDVDQANWMALNNLAYDLAIENPDEALSFGQKAAELAPDDPNVQDTLGWIYYRKSIYSTAIRYLETAASKKPSPQRQFHLGMAYLKFGNRERGLSLVQTALKQEPTLAKTEQGW